ncbi:hypothetical protein BaRGS_00001222 [Batillaria attramentaria]|uniref:Ig-like domain-containing protein n=1 Tax=Batillaria attramentaria TaxID=370345 RepID=A0ABD0M6K2_9CAEN
MQGRLIHGSNFPHLSYLKATSTLEIRQEPRAVYNKQTGQFHVQLTCISHHGTTRAVIWTNPLGHQLNSSSSDGDEFRLLLPNPVTSGLYDCCALAPNKTCLESSSASVLVDNVDASFMVMEAEHSDRLKRMDAKFSKMNDEQSVLLQNLNDENKGLKQQMETLQSE